MVGHSIGGFNLRVFAARYPNDVSGVVLVDAEAASRIANSIGPAFDGFAAVAGTLPFDLEPATFVVVQTAKVTR